MTRFQRARGRIGAALMAASLLVGIVAAPAAVAEGELPEERQEVTVEREGFWNADYSKYSKNAATKQFPPEAVCLVQPTACFFPEGGGDPSAPLPTGSITGAAPSEDCARDTGGLGAVGNTLTCEIDQAMRGFLTTLAENDEGYPPADPVQPDTLPVSVAFGQPNYRSAVDIELPSIPAGDQVDSFTMVLTEEQPTYSNESPAFRQAVLAALTCASENEASPIGRCTQEEFEKIANTCPDTEDGVPCLVYDKHLTVEACPIISDWEGTESQDEDTLPEVDCLYSAVGTPVTTDDGTFWVFDLTFAAQAWYAGDIAENGLLLRPGAAENFAYGDPETTYSKQVTFANVVQAAVTSSEAPPAPPPFSAPSFDSGSSGSFGSDTGSFGSGGFSAPASSTPMSSPTTSTPMADSPAVSDTPVEQPATAGEEQPVTLAAGTPLGQPTSPWWLWAMVPMFLAGAWLLSRSLTETAVAGAATRGGGAMTRLLERQAAVRGDGLVTG